MKGRSRTTVNEIMDFIAGYNKEAGEATQAECAYQGYSLELIASESIISESVMMVMGTVLTNKYAGGYSGKCYYDGCQCMDVVGTMVVGYAKRLPGCDHTNVQPHTGAQANMVVFVTILKPGDTVMGMSLDHGGHLTHESPVSFSGLYFNIVPYGVNDEGYTGYDELEWIAKEIKPELIMVGASAYARVIGFKRSREIVNEAGAYPMASMVCTAGLVTAGEYPSLIPYVDVVTTITHKTLRGPRGGMILANKEVTGKFNFNKVIFPGTQGGLLEYVIAGRAICPEEVLELKLKEYQHRVVLNAKVLAEVLQNQGFRLLIGDMNNHLTSVDLQGMDTPGKELQNRCDEVFITLDKNTAPNDPRNPSVTSGVRTGALTITTRGLKEDDMSKTAKCTWLAATDLEDQADYIRGEVIKPCDKYPTYKQGYQSIQGACNR